jgi:hypothetical protein
MGLIPASKARRSRRPVKDEQLERFSLCTVVGMREFAIMATEVAHTMTLRIDIPPELEAKLAAEAQVEGTSPEQFLRNVLERELACRNAGNVRPFRTYRGALAKYGPGPSAAEIEQNRSEMLGGTFARGDQ